MIGDVSDRKVRWCPNYNTILSASGTEFDPYTVQEDWSWFDNAQVLQ